MPRRILIVQGHPDPDPGRLCRALAQAYAEGARGAGFLVELVDLASLDIPLLRTKAEFETKPVPESLAHAAEALKAADHLVLVFPLWLGTMPALVKAFLEQVMRPGTAFRYRPNGFPQALLDGKSARLVVTMGMPALAYRLWYFSHGLRGLERNILKFAGIGPVSETLLGGVGTADETTRRRWIENLVRLGATGH